MAFIGNSRYVSFLGRSHESADIRFSANYGQNALEFFNDATSALSDKLTAAGGTVQVGVLKDVSIVNTLYTQMH